MTTFMAGTEQRNVKLSPETTSGADAEIAAAWILRRVGFGATVDDLERAADIGIEKFLDQLFDPDGQGIIDDGDPWAGIDVPLIIESPRDVAPSIAAWLDRFRTASRPTAEWMAWFWHGHLVSSFATVRSPRRMVNQIRLFRDLGAGPLQPLLGAITIDPAMLRYLDGGTSTGRNPNENYGRELLELFTLGVGNYTEADVQAAARALTGWTARRRAEESVFVPRRHDNSPQSFLGKEGVHDVDTVVEAIVEDAACPRFIVGALAEAVLGTGLAPETTSTEAELFAVNNLTVGPLVRRLVERGLAGASEPIVLTPVPWLVGAIRMTESTLDLRAMSRLLRSAGQIPLVPPNVAGWPTGDAWLTSSATVARLEASRVLADEAGRNSAPMVAAAAGDLDELARALGRPEGFSTTTNDALLDADVTGRSLLALALSTPELVIG
jgi:uncharacterized protein (DUF1800 family)